MHLAFPSWQLVCRMSIYESQLRCTTLHLSHSFLHYSQHLILTAMSSEASLAVGQRLLHVTIDEIAAKTPERSWGSIPRSANLSDGYRDISYATLANAINRLSWFLESEISQSTAFEAVAYIGELSIRQVNPPSSSQCRPAGYAVSHNVHGSSQDRIPGKRIPNRILTLAQEDLHSRHCSALI